MKEKQKSKDNDSFAEIVKMRINVLCDPLNDTQMEELAKLEQQYYSDMSNRLIDDIAKRNR